MIKLSIIIPVYNEAKTFSQLYNLVKNIQLPNINKEIIIIESNSNDGTRDLVLKCKDDLGVKIILQEFPKGKGNAVRYGLKEATGDIILIQDADLEYDVNDYMKLIKPIITNKTDFVLGSRHSSERRSWKLRKFNNNQFFYQFYLNLGHLIFLALFNIVYNQNLKDPFTMYKVFKRDLIDDIDFEADGFDFDWELMAKLIRNGHIPLEIPVNYKSRSFLEGKKTRLIQDPYSWIIACFKYRFCRLK